MARKRNGEGAVVDKPEETKADKFKRLANRRLRNAVKALRALANLGNRKQYERTDEQTEILFSVLGRAWDRVKTAYSEHHEEANGQDTYF